MIRKQELIASICKSIGITRKKPKMKMFSKTELYALDFFIKRRLK